MRMYPKFTCKYILPAYLNRKHLRIPSPMLIASKWPTHKTCEIYIIIYLIISLLKNQQSTEKIGIVSDEIEKKETRISNENGRNASEFLPVFAMHGFSLVAGWELQFLLHQLVFLHISPLVPFLEERCFPCFFEAKPQDFEFFGPYLQFVVVLAPNHSRKSHNSFLSYKDLKSYS